MQLRWYFYFIIIPLFFQDMYIYVSEQEEFTDFKNDESLFWQKKGLTYGDWKSGPNGDGSFLKSGQIHASEASIFL